MATAFTVDLDLALSGKGAPPRAAYDAALSRSAAALDWLRQQQASRGLELLGIPSRADDLKAAAKQAAALKGFATIAVLGIGGSSLGGQALTALRKVQKPFVEFHDNPDPFSWDAALKRFDLKKTHFIAISKSGGTAETLMQVLTAAEALTKAGAKSLKKHFTIITEPKKSALADFADSIGAPRLSHPEGVGGRYSVLTVVGVLPAILMGLDVRKLRAGAQAILD